MATKGAYKRLTKEYMSIQKNPPPFITAKPLESNILEWHYVIQGPPDTPYEGGEYYGKLIFPAEYPFKPPTIKMTTPSGRFQPNTRLCLTMSDFHPSLWNPSWSVPTILNGLLSFMVGDETTTGSIRTTDLDKRRLAVRSHLWNIKNSKFREVFPELCTIKFNTIPSNITHENTSLRNRNVVQQQQQPQPVRETELNDQHAISRTVMQGKRWLFVLVVFVYLVLSKLIARSSAN